MVTYPRQPLLINPDNRRILRYVTHIADWQYSTFHRDVEAGLYPESWGGVNAPTFDPTDGGQASFCLPTDFDRSAWANDRAVCPLYRASCQCRDHGKG
ncbi:MAG: hypothetical protein WCK96_18170 [Methylococcales bacterium]